MVRSRLREVCSCCCLTFLLGPASLGPFLATFYKPFSGPLYMQIYYLSLPNNLSLISDIYWIHSPPPACKHVHACAPPANPSTLISLWPICLLDVLLKIFPWQFWHMPRGGDQIGFNAIAVGSIFHSVFYNEQQCHSRSPISGFWREARFGGGALRLPLPRRVRQGGRRRIRRRQGISGEIFLM